MTTTETLIVHTPPSADTQTALRFITCGSVDDGKSTLIGRLLLDSRAVLQDQLAHVTHQASGQINAAELARLTDGLQAEREQGITIDVAWRYFTSAQRKFIIGDAPGHEQYTRNMVTAASQADCAVVLVDATKLVLARQTPNNPDQEQLWQLLPQTRRHTLLAHLLRVPHIVFAINKLDAVPDAASAFAHIASALHAFCQQAGINARATVPVSALMGWNVVDARPGWSGYHGPSLLQLLEQLPHTAPETLPETALPLAMPVQWVEKFSASADTRQSRRVLWGRIGTGQARPGMQITVFPSGQSATIAQVLNHSRAPQQIAAPHSAGIVLDRELDISRGDWLLAADAPALRQTQTLHATIAWLDDAPLAPGRAYWALHGHRWVKAKVTRVLHALDIHTLTHTEAQQLGPNAIGQVELALQTPLPVLPYTQSRTLGALILADSASHATAAAVLVQ